MINLINILNEYFAKNVVSLISQTDKFLEYISFISAV